MSEENQWDQGYDNPPPPPPPPSSPENGWGSPSSSSGWDMNPQASTPPPSPPPPPPLPPSYGYGYEQANYAPRPPAGPQQHPQTTLWFVLSLVSLICCQILSPVVLVMSILALKESKERPDYQTDNNLLLAAAILSGLGALFGVAALGINGLDLFL